MVELLKIMEIIWQLDQKIFKFIHYHLRFSYLDFPMILLTSSGLGHIQLLFFFLFYSIFPKARLKLVSILSCGAFAGIIRLPIMMWIQRERPSNFNFFTPLEHVYAPTSFPSGHATTSFAIAFSTWALTYKTPNSWVGYVMIFWSIAVGYSRCYVGVHYFSDVIGAFVLALICNHIWLNILMKKRWFIYRENFCE